MGYSARSATIIYTTQAYTGNNLLSAEKVRLTGTKLWQILALVKLKVRAIEFEMFSLTDR